MNFDDIIKNSFEAEAASMELKDSRSAEILNAVEARAQAKKAGIKYKISKLLSRIRFVEVLEVAAFAAVLIVVPLVGSHYKNSAGLEAKIDNNAATIKKDSSLHLSRDVTTGAGVIVTITPLKNNYSNIKISNEDIEKLMKEAAKDEVKALSINDIIVTEKSSFEDYRSKGYILVDGAKLALDKKITVKIIGNKDKLYKGLTSEDTANKVKKWCEIKVDKTDTVNIGSLDPQKVVENYFKYMNEKNKEKLLENLTEWHNNTIWGFENLEYIKIINIVEETDPTQKNGYLYNGNGKINGATEENLKVYRVDYEQKNKKDGIGPQDSGKYTWWFFVIRKSSSSPWLIDDFGV